MNVLWTAAEAAEATGGTTIGDWAASGVSIDTRTLAAGDLFIALEGPHRDGHDFLADAFARGAAAAILARDTWAGNPRVLRVPDTFAALNALAAAARRRSQAKIAAVTGSVGKTGTKEVLALLLSSWASTMASEASLNNHWGVPLSLARLSRETRFGVFELGMNHMGEIGPLSRLVRPHVALITTVDAAHLGHFPSLDAIAEAKGEIFEGLDPGGIAVLNRDNPYYERLEKKARAAGAREIVAFGADPRSQIRLLDCLVAERESQVEVSIGRGVLSYRLPLAGRHWVMNSLAALAAVFALGADPQVAGAAFSRLKALSGRGRRHELPWHGGTLSVIDESYNASPSAMRAALSVLARSEPGEGGRRLAVLGDMLELGKAAPSLHRELLQPILEAGVDKVFLVGEAVAALNEILPAGKRGGLWPTVEEAIPSLLSDFRPGDVVTIKASHGVGAHRIVETLLQGWREGET